MNGNLYRKIFTIIEIMKTEARLRYLRENFVCCVGEYLLQRQTTDLDQKTKIKNLSY